MVALGLRSAMSIFTTYVQKRNVLNPKLKRKKEKKRKTTSNATNFVIRFFYHVITFFLIHGRTGKHGRIETPLFKLSTYLLVRNFFESIFYLSM